MESPQTKRYSCSSRGNSASSSSSLAGCSSPFPRDSSSVGIATKKRRVTKADFEAEKLTPTIRAEQVVQTELNGEEPTRNVVRSKSQSLLKRLSGDTASDSTLSNRTLIRNDCSIDLENFRFDAENSENQLTPAKQLGPHSLNTEYLQCQKRREIDTGVPFVNKKAKSNGFRERYHRICDNHFNGSQECTCFPELPLELLFIGLNPSEESWETGVSYGHPSNLFWKIIIESGLITLTDEEAEGVDSDFGKGVAKIQNRYISRPSSLLVYLVFIKFFVRHNKCDFPRESSVVKAQNSSGRLAYYVLVRCHMQFSGRVRSLQVCCDSPEPLLRDCDTTE